MYQGAEILIARKNEFQNDILKEMEVFNLETLTPILINMAIILGFSLLFIILTNIVTKKKLKKS